MQTRRPPNRSLASGVTATTFVVLMAMASAATVASAPGFVPLDGRVRLGESKAVRAVAEAVAAAARDMIGEQQSTAALPPLPAASGTQRPIGAPAVMRSVHLPAGPADRLGERRLDLPPPLA